VRNNPSAKDRWEKRACREERQIPSRAPDKYSPGRSEEIPGEDL